MQVALINGPNLNLLGKRQPHIYGSQSFDSYLPQLQAQFPEVELIYFQSNQEGVLVEAVQRFGASAEAILLNPGAFTHTSIALADAVSSVVSPVYEIHLSNVFARQDFRKHSYISAQAKAVICGLGLQGYAAALQAVLIDSESKS